MINFGEKKLARVAKYIASSGLCSRRMAESLILAGKVTVDGKIITTPALNIEKNNIVEVDGKIIKPQEQVKLWLYYKPVGLITTHKDPYNRPTVFDSLKASLPGVISVGRLDLNSEGLLLLTNSGKLANQLELPKNNFERIYKVRAYGDHAGILDAIKNGTINNITIEGLTYRPKKFAFLKKNNSNSWFEIVLAEGKNREIRKIFEYFNMKVNRLIRTHYGKYRIGKLKPGEFIEVDTEIDPKN